MENAVKCLDPFYFTQNYRASIKLIVSASHEILPAFQWCCWAVVNVMLLIMYKIMNTIATRDEALKSLKPQINLHRHSMESCQILFIFNWTNAVQNWAYANGQLKTGNIRNPLCNCWRSANGLTDWNMRIKSVLLRYVILKYAAIFKSIYKYTASKLTASVETNSSRWFVFVSIAR